MAKSARKTTKTGKIQSKKTMGITSNGAFVRKNRANYSEKAWVVFTTNNDRMVSPRVFDAQLTRDDVRNAYSKEFGVRIQETRSRRVANVK